jgi:hypothetical protein
MAVGFTVARPNLLGEQDAWAWVLKSESSKSEYGIRCDSTSRYVLNADTRYCWSAMRCEVYKRDGNLNKMPN